MKILIIEDEILLQEAVRNSLESEGYLVDTEITGSKGLECALTGIYDAILLDIMLPEMDGIEVLKNLRKEKIDTPVIMLTARIDLESKLEGFNNGADDYLAKPFDMPELFARIRSVTRRRGSRTSDVLTCGNSQLDTRTYMLNNISGGQSISLAGKEYQILEYLMLNESQVISREQITEKIWGFDSNAEYNNVDVYVTFIRRKLAFIDSNVLIKAVRGIGYRLTGGDENA